MAERIGVQHGARRESHDYTLEVCKACGAQLDRYGNGRCPVNSAHHGYGGIVVRVVARPDAEQDHVSFRSGVVPAVAQIAVAPTDMAVLAARVETLDAVARVLDRGIPDDRKLATIARLVYAAASDDKNASTDKPDHP